MRLMLALPCLALAFASPALAHNARPAIGLDLAAASYVTELGTVLAETPHCVTRVLMAGETPASTDPALIDSITCLNTACTTREVVLCRASTP